MSDDNLVERGAGVFDVSGRMTFETVPALFIRGQSLFAGSGALTLNLSAVTLADSAGLALLLEWLQEARDAGRELHYDGFPDQIQRLIQVSGLNEAFGLK